MHLINDRPCRTWQGDLVIAAILGARDARRSGAMALVEAVKAE
jgi:hypothetical protein